MDYEYNLYTNVLLNREVSYESSQQKMMTLTCATCLTVGMGAVAYADTVDLGYGFIWQYVSYGESCRSHARSYGCKAT